MKTVLIITVIITIVLALAATGCAVKDAQGTKESRSLAVPTPVPNPQATPQRPAPRPTHLPPHPSELHRVIRVVDGDTVHIDVDGEDRTYRVIGIDTPETVKPNSPVECYGPEASAEAKRLLTGASVAVRPDPTQRAKDDFGRYLAYIVLPDGTDFGHWMILNGYAREARYGSDYTRMLEYRAAQNVAVATGTGLWGAC